MLPFSIMTFMSFTQAPSTPRRVLVARFTPSLIAASKLSGFVVLISVTRATVTCTPSLAFPYKNSTRRNARLNANDGRSARRYAPLGEGRGEEYVARRHRGSLVRLQRDGGGVGALQGRFDGGRGGFAVRLEEAGGLRHPAVQHPRLIDLPLRRGRKVLRHEHGRALPGRHHLPVRPARRARAP